MAGNGFKWMKIAGNNRKWLEMAGMAGNGWNGLKVLEMAGSCNKLIFLCVCFLQQYPHIPDLSVNQIQFLVFSATVFFFIFCLDLFVSQSHVLVV